MKKIITLLMVSMLVMFSFAACGSSQETAEDQNTTAEEQTQTEETETSDAPEAASGDVLILYFSAANMTDADAVTGATPMGDADGTTGWMAQVIQEQTGGEAVPITASEAYPADYNDTADKAKDEADNDARPAYEPLDIDPTQYSTVFIGYPIWWYQMPMVMYTFFDDYDFDGVTIVPFNTHEGSGDGGTYDDIRTLEPNANVLDGFALRGGKAGDDSARDDIIQWINGLGL